MGNPWDNVVGAVTSGSPGRIAGQFIAPGTNFDPISSISDAGNSVNQGIADLQNGVRDIFKKDPAPTPPGEDPRLTKIREAQQKQADQFSANANQTKNTLYNNLAQGERAQLTNNLSAVNQNNSARGLLNSGINEGQQAGVRAESSQAMAGARAGINSGVDNAASQLQYQAANANAQQQHTAQSLQDSVYSQALQSMANRNNALGGLMQAGGYAAGSYFGNKKGY